MSTPQRVEAAVTAILQLLEAVDAHPDLELFVFEEVPGAPAAQLDAFGAATGRPLSPALRAWFSAPKVKFSIQGDAEFHFSAVYPHGLETVREALEWWGDLDLAEQIEQELAEFPEAAEEYNLLQVQHLRHGLPLWEPESTVVVDTRSGAVGRFDGESGPSDPIASDLAEFLEHFLAAGMFDYGGADRAHFDAYWALVAELVAELAPVRVAPRDNLWLQHLDRRYGGDLTVQTGAVAGPQR